MGHRCNDLQKTYRSRSRAVCGPVRRPAPDPRSRRGTTNFDGGRFMLILCYSIRYVTQDGEVVANVPRGS